MKNTKNAAKLLELPYAPEADALLDELERSGQFRVGLEAEVDDAADSEAASNDYAWGRGSGNVTIQDWWTTGRVALRIGPGIAPSDLVLSRINESLVLRTPDGLDRATLEGYLGLIPDAATLRIVFDDGTEWAAGEILSRIASWLVSVESGADRAQ